MAFENWWAFVLISILPAFSPGPGLLLTMNNALRFGPSLVIYSASANAIGLVIVGFGVAMGLSALMKASALLFLAIKIAGAFYLAYLGIKMWRDRTGLSLGDIDEPAGVPPRSRLFVQALVVALTNPKAIVLLAALLPPFMSNDLPATPQVLALSTTYAVMCLFSHATFAAAAGWIRPWLKTERRARNVQKTFGASFVGSGLSVLAR